MLTEGDLTELLGYHAKHAVVSVYLDVDPTEGSADAYKLRLRSMLKDIEQKEDARAIERYIEHKYDWSGKSVAIFSCAPEKYLRAFSLAVPIRDRVRISDHPHVKPLADLLDAYGGYGVALVDKQGARLFYFHLGELREQEGTLGESVRRTKRGQASSMPGRRSGPARQSNTSEAIAERNMREAANLAATFFTDNNVRRILIGGTEDNVATFRTLLPKAWQSLIVGSFQMSMTANNNEVLERAMQIGREADHHRAARLVSAIVTASAKGRGGVIRLDDTLGALHEGRIQTLVIHEGYRAPGYRCEGCDYLTAQALKTCPFCGKTFKHIPDAVEMAVRQVLTLGGEVEVLHDDKLAKKIANIGALLRY